MKACKLFETLVTDGGLQQGWTTLISILLLGFGITNISLGVIAEYLWRTLDETRGRPRYIIDQKLNFDNANT